MKVGRKATRWDIKVPIRFDLVMPTPDRAWQEGIQLAYAFALMESSTIDYIMQPILAGFKMNFATEGASGPGAWKRLAEWTQSERLQLMGQESFMGSLVPGFSPTHPILQRTGEYMRSWIEKGHPLHGREDEPHGMVGRVIMEGSEDRRAEELSLGLPGPYALPARPVAIVAGLYETSMAAKVDAALARYAMTVQP